MICLQTQLIWAKQDRGIEEGALVLKSKSKTENADGNLVSGAPPDLVSLYTVNLNK